uniref:CCHC-type domain-containing protein n=1 Tax=Tanacetum cinerariifolium TaxID=118510 RepID=A0A6L2LDR1_TANCI|nr:hypothetical protein [Tanacetum cinerariifolium]
MATVNDVPQLVYKKGGLEPYYLKCIKDGPFQPKTAEGDAKPESQWNLDERKDFQENVDDEVDERSSEEYLRDLDIDYREGSLLENSKHFIKRRNKFSSEKANENTDCYKCGNKGHYARECFSNMSNSSYQSPVNNYSSVSKGFQLKFTPKLIQSAPNSSSQADPKFQKDYKAEYKKMKAKLALLESSPSSSQNPKV